MNVPKRASVRSKMLKGETEAGHEYYYSKRPRSRKADHAVSKAKPLPANARSVTVTAKKK